MLNELDESLKTLLVQDLPRVIERIEADGFDISFDVPNRDFRARLTRPTLCLYLYNIQENRDLRGRVWSVSRQDSAVTTRRPAVRLDCSYMVTAWSNEVEDEHRLLTGATRVLFRNPVLPAEVLQGSLADGYEISTEVAQPESFKDVVDIWSVLDNDLHPSVRVTVTLPLELDVEYATPTVSDRGLRLDGPNWRPPPQGPQRVTGRVERDGQPVIGAVIRADYSSTHTDDRGEYKLDNVMPGKQLLWVRLGASFHQFEVDLPDESLIILPSEGEALEDNAGGPGSPPPGNRPRARRVRSRQQE
ncbi:MAG: DUF4255 domain-containing protein [Dehalococcoidia bacterium]|nr:DUF4255 domain-containing protein [Dehalococcoidia bacterium]